MVKDQIVVKQLLMSEILADDEFNCRGQISPIDVVDLAKDIETRGLIQPVAVTPLEGKPPYKWRLIAGFRRFMAHKVLKRTLISASICAEMDEAEARIFNLSENIQRKDLDIVQEARALRRLRDLGVPREHVAAKLGKSGTWVQVRYYLLDLPEPIQQEVQAGYITQSQIRDLWSIHQAAGEEATFEATKKLKDAKILGKKAVTLNPNKIKPTAKNHRSRTEIFTMIDMIADSGMKFGIHTRCLAWCAGEISTRELIESLKLYAEEQGWPANFKSESLEIEDGHAVS